MNFKGSAEVAITVDESLSEGSKSVSNLNTSDSSSSQRTSLSLTSPQHTTRQRLRLTRGGAKLWRKFSKKRSNSHGSVKMANNGMADELFVDDSDVILQDLVQLMNCFQTQQRYLILLNTALVITKQRSSASYHVKDEVRLSEIWLADCIDQVSEVVPDRDRSFVIGWPTVNLVATFASVQGKDTWLEKLQHQIELEKARNWPQNVVIKIVSTSQEFSVTKHMLVGNSDDAKSILSRCVQEMHLMSDSVDDFQFWVQSDRENHPYPLIGHEYPYAIQMNYMRDKQGVVHSVGLADSLCEGLKFQIMSKQVKPKLSMKLSLDETRRTPKKSSKIVKLFQKSSRSVEIGSIFGRDLNSLFHGDSLCPPIMDMLIHLYLYGPSTVDIFRKSAIVSKCQEVKQHLDHGDKIDFNDLHVFVSAALLKELLRCLPNCLLLSEFYSKWIKISAVLKSQVTAVSRIKSLVDLLPLSHQTLLRHLVCILHKISQNSQHNGMTAYSLSVCISQTLLWQRSQSGVGLTQVNDAKKLNAVVERMIDSAGEIFGDECLHLFDRLEPRLNRKQTVDPVSSRRGSSSLDIVQEEETHLNDTNEEFNFSPLGGSDVLYSSPSPASDSYDSGLAASTAMSCSDLTTPTAIPRPPLADSGQGDDEQLFPVGSSSALDCRKQPTRCNIGSVGDWFRATFEDDSHFLYNENGEFGVLSDINFNLPNSIIQQKFIENKILNTSANRGALDKSESTKSDGSASRSEPASTKTIDYDDVVAKEFDQNKLCTSVANENSLAVPISLDFLSDHASVDQQNSATSSFLDKNISETYHKTNEEIHNIPEVASASEVEKYLEESVPAVGEKLCGSFELNSSICKNPENVRSAESNAIVCSNKQTSKSNLLRLRRGMTEGGGDIFPKQFVERFHCAFADSAVSSGSCLKVKNLSSNRSNVLREKLKSSVGSSHQTLMPSAVLKPIYVQSGQQGSSKSVAPLGPVPFHRRQQGDAIHVGLRPSSSALQQSDTWQYVASLRCFSNGQRLRPIRPPSYEEAIAKKSQMNRTSGTPSPSLQSSVFFPQTTLADKTSDALGSCSRNAGVCDRNGNVAPSLPTADDRRSDVRCIRNPVVTNPVVEYPTLEMVNHVTNTAESVSLRAQTDDSLSSKFSRKLPIEIENRVTAETRRRLTGRVLPEYTSRPNASSGQNCYLNAGSAQTEMLQSKISSSSFNNFLHKSCDKRSVDIPVLSPTDSDDVNYGLLSRQGVERGVKKRRQRQHYSDPKLRTCRPICLGLGRSKSDSCEIIGRKCEGCMQKEDKENFVCSNSVLKRKLDSAKQLSNLTEPNRFNFIRTRSPLSSDLSVVKEDFCPANKAEVESSYSPKDLKKKRSVVFSCHDENVKLCFPSKSCTENQSDKDVSSVLDNMTFACIKKSESCSKNSVMSDSLVSANEHNSQILQPLSSGGISTPDRLLYVFRSAKSMSPDETKVDWSVSELKKVYNDDNGSECSVTKSSLMIPLHDSPYFV